MFKTINDITIEEVSQAAKGNADKYIDRAKGIAEQAFIEGVMWAQKEYSNSNSNRPKYTAQP